MHKKDHSKEHEAKVDLTPMIDMVFLLVMFFVLTSSFVLLEEMQLPVALEAQDMSKREGGGGLIINIRKTDDDKRTGEIVYNREPVTPEQLVMELKKEAQLDASRREWDDPVKKTSKLEVVVRADEGVQGHYLRQVFEACGKAGIWKVSLSAVRQ